MQGSAQAGAQRRSMIRRFARPAVVAVLLSTAVASEPFLTPAFAQSYSFSQVVIEGNDRVDAATILSYAGIARGKSVSAGELNDAYQRIVNAGLFESVEIIPKGGTLVIRVKEFPMLNVVDFQGNKRLKDESLSKIIKSESWWLHVAKGCLLKNIKTVFDHQG